GARGTAHRVAGRLHPARAGVRGVDRAAPHGRALSPAVPPKRGRYGQDPAIAAARMRDVLGRMMRGSTSRPSVRARRTSFPEMETGFSPGWLSIRSTRPADS